MMTYDLEAATKAARQKTEDAAVNHQVDPWVTVREISPDFVEVTASMSPRTASLLFAIMSGKLKRIEFHYD